MVIIYTGVTQKKRSAAPPICTVIPSFESHLCHKVIGILWYGHFSIFLIFFSSVGKKFNTQKRYLFVILKLI